jgi:hypothetical protein
LLANANASKSEKQKPRHAPFSEWSFIQEI